MGRHLIDRGKLERLYRDLDRYIADCTPEEVKENRESFIRIKSLIHKHILER